MMIVMEMMTMMTPIMTRTSAMLPEVTGLQEAAALCLEDSRCLPLSSTLRIPFTPAMLSCFLTDDKILFVSYFHPPISPTFILQYVLLPPSKISYFHPPISPTATLQYLLLPTLQYLQGNSNNLHRLIVDDFTDSMTYLLMVGGGDGCLS